MIVSVSVSVRAFMCFVCMCAFVHACMCVQKRNPVLGKYLLAKPTCKIA